jgi:hypothetical protein
VRPIRYGRFDIRPFLRQNKQQVEAVQKARAAREVASAFVLQVLLRTVLDVAQKCNKKELAQLQFGIRENGALVQKHKRAAAVSLHSLVRKQELKLRERDEAHSHAVHQLKRDHLMELQKGPSALGESASHLSMELFEVALHTREEQHARELATKQAHQTAVFEAQEEHMEMLQEENQQQQRAFEHAQENHVRAERGREMEHEKVMARLSAAHAAELQSRELSFAVSVSTLARDNSSVSLQEVRVATIDHPYAHCNTIINTCMMRVHILIAALAATPTDPFILSRCGRRWSMREC